MRRRAALGSALALAAALPGCAQGQISARGATSAAAPPAAPPALPARALPGGPAPPPLRQQASAAGRSFGAAIRSELLGTDAPYAALFAAEAEVLTPEWEAKWEAMQPEEGRFDFTHLNTILAFAHQNQQRVRGHALLWHEAMPIWLPTALAEGEVRARGLLEAHFGTVLQTTRPTIRDWDVVNEPIANPRGSDNPQAGNNPLRETPWFRALGPNYIEAALRLARAQDPTLRLTINEYGIEEATPDAEIKRARLLALLRHLLDRGSPLDALGIQAHLQLRRPFAPDVFARFVSQVRDMGLAVLITEMDVREADALPGTIAARDAAVATRTREFLGAAIGAGCRTAITWGLSDRDSWLVKEATVARPDGVPTRGLPFDGALLHKPMWQAIADVMR